LVNETKNAFIFAAFCRRKQRIDKFNAQFFVFRIFNVYFLHLTRRFFYFQTNQRIMGKISILQNGTEFPAIHFAHSIPCRNAQFFRNAARADARHFMIVHHSCFLPNSSLAAVCISYIV